MDARDGERRTAWERLTGLDPRLWDALLAAVVLAVSLATYGLSRMGDGEPGIRQADGVGAALLVAACVALYWRRRRPFASALTVAGLVLAYAAARYVSDAPGLALLVAVYSAAAYQPRGWRLNATIVAGTAATLALQASGTVGVRAGSGGGWVEWTTAVAFYVALPVLLGRIRWNRRRRLDRDRESAAREAVLLERERIARELHDVVAHSMSVMVVQAGGARSVLRRDPDAAERALRSIEESGRIGLAEMRRLLAEERDGAAALAPQPGLGDLDALLARMRATGLSVELVTEGERRPLAPGLDLSAYRVVQEGLTNALKHAGADAHARVLLRYADDALEVEVADDGRGPSGATEPGVGLIGMRERVAFLHGELTTGPRPGGGFLVEARIPLEPDGGAG